MTFKTKKNWPSASYDSEINNITTEFFIPAFYESITYRRIAGLFSSNSFALAARGLTEFVNNDGKIQLLISPILTKDDIRVLSNSDKPEFNDIIKKSLLENINLTNEFEKDHIFALIYLLKNDVLEIKIYIPKDASGNILDFEKIISQNMFAEKLGIFQDRKGNVITFRGPIDENKESWEQGKFSITIDVSWESGQKIHVDDDIKKFQKQWDSKDSIDLPLAIKMELIKKLPENFKTCLKKYDVPDWAILSNGKKLWDNQITAVNSWFKNQYRGIFPIATSGGKTIAAITCAKRLPTRVVILVIVPLKELAKQWAEEIKKNDSSSESIICDGDHSDWKNKLTKRLNRYSLDSTYEFKNRLYVIGVSDTVIRKSKNSDASLFITNFRHVKPADIMIVGDEVHNFGAKENQKIFDIDAKYRLGLSATHERQWDDEGTDAIIEYFGRSLSEAGYTVSQGIADGRLSEYSYHPYFTTLTTEEFKKYKELTIEIGRLSNMSKKNPHDDSIKKKLASTMNLRSDILKNAENKINVYKKIITSNPNPPYIIFADDNVQLKKLRTAHNEIIKNINQSSKIMKSTDTFIFSGDTDPSQRTQILKQSAIHDRPIFCMYCLDEGIDVPEFNGAILIASSRSKRQYIQRRGRILRKSKKYPTKQLYDIIIFPPKQTNSSEIDMAKNIIDKEYERFFELSHDAINHSSSIEQYNDEKKRLGY